MLVVKLEFWPGGRESQAKLIGLTSITNDGTGTPESGNYDVAIKEFGEVHREMRITRVEGYPRKTSGAWKLLWMALSRAFCDKDVERTSL